MTSELLFCFSVLLSFSKGTTRNLFRWKGASAARTLRLGAQEPDQFGSVGLYLQRSAPMAGDLTTLLDPIEEPFDPVAGAAHS
jgi:hypothetical protein